MVKTTIAVYLIFYKLIVFETLITFLESTIELITEIIWFAKVIAFLIITAQVLFFKKDPHLNASRFSLCFLAGEWKKENIYGEFLSLLASEQLIEVTGMIMAVWSVTFRFSKNMAT